MTTRQNVTFAERLQTLLDESELSQEDFADSLGIDQPTLSRYLSGRIPRLPNIKRLADKAQVNQAWLEGLSKDRHELPKPEDLSDEALELARLYDQDKTGDAAMRYIFDSKKPKTDKAAKRSKSRKPKNNSSTTG